MSWITLAVLCLRIANGLIQRAERAGAIAEGDRQAIARLTREIERDACIARDIEAETAKMSPENIVRDLEGRGEFRD